MISDNYFSGNGQQQDGIANGQQQAQAYYQTGAS